MKAFTSLFLCYSLLNYLNFARSSWNTKSCPIVNVGNLAISNKTTTSFWISWNGTNLTSHIGYRIQWQNYTCLTNESIDLSGKENISHVITGLSPNVLYTVQVTPICNQSIEIAARANTSVLTLGQVVTVAPKNVSVSDLLNTSVIFEWSQLSPCEWGGHPVTYIVYISDLSNGEEHQFNCSVRTSSALIHWLKVSQIYNISVSAVNEYGVGPQSVPITFTPSDTCAKDSLCIFLRTHLYYVIAVGGAILLALFVTCLAFCCKKTVCNRKVTYCRDLENKQLRLSNKVHSPDGDVNLEDIASMTSYNPSVHEPGRPHQQRHNVPLYDEPKASAMQPPLTYQSLQNNQYATLEPVDRSSADLDSISSNTENEPSPIPSQESGNQNIAFPYEVPSVNSSVGMLQHLPNVVRSQEHVYQSVDDSHFPSPSYTSTLPPLKSNTMPSWPSSRSTSRNPSEEPALPFGHFSQTQPFDQTDLLPAPPSVIPPPPSHAPPPLRRSTLDLVQKLKEESVIEQVTHNPSLLRARTPSVDLLYRRSPYSQPDPHRRSSVPDLFDSHSPIFSSGDSLANHGPTQTPPPILLLTDNFTWNKASPKSVTQI